MPEFRYPNVTPILHDPEISNGVFKQLKDLFIETISRPVSISNVNFSHEMKNNLEVRVEHIQDYKALYLYIIEMGTMMYYKLCENFSQPIEPGWELHPNYCWFFVQEPNYFSPMHQHSNKQTPLGSNAPCPFFECNGAIYLNTFDEEKELKYLEANSFPDINRAPSIDGIDLATMKKSLKETSRGSLKIDFGERWNDIMPNGYGDSQLHLMPREKECVVLANYIYHMTYPHFSDQLRISFVFNSALHVEPGRTAHNYSTMWSEPLRLNPMYAKQTFKLDEDFISRCKKSVNVDNDI